MSFWEIFDYGYLGKLFGDFSSAENVRMYWLGYIILAVVSYLVGSVNCGVILSRKYGTDIRTKGSGNAGTTNMLRIYGKRAAILTFLGDVLKSALASVIGRLFFGIMGAYVAGFFCIIGHAYPIFFKFRGGKGVVAISTMCLMTTPIVFLVMLGIFLIILFGFKMVSLASVMVMLIYPMVLYNMTFPGPHILVAVLCSLFVIFLHRSNIVRIYRHEESKISFGKKKKDNGEDGKQNE
ncbi:MAG: glycerol-3-phosphate 1-O-acyltransferase PlsY [Eubacteriales bacterium]